MRDTSGCMVFIITTTRITWFFNRNIFILIYRYIINNRFRYTNRDFFLNSVRYNSSLYTFRLRILSIFMNWLKCRFLSWSLLELYLNFFSINSWLCDSLCIIYVTWNINLLSSRSLLINSFFSKWSIINDLIFFLSPFNINIFSLLDRLNIWLSNVLIGRDGIRSDINIVLNFSFSFNRRKSFCNSFSGQNLNLSSNFFNCRLNNVAIVNNITRNINSLSSGLIFILNIHSNWVLVNNLVLLLLILRSNLFDGFVNGRLYDDSLSSWFNNLFSYDSWFTCNSFCNNFWLGSNSLSDDFWFCLYTLLHNLCVLEVILHVHRVGSSKGSISISLS